MDDGVDDSVMEHMTTATVQVSAMPFDGWEEWTGPKAEKFDEIWEQLQDGFADICRQRFGDAGFTVQVEVDTE